MYGPRTVEIGTPTARAVADQQAANRGGNAPRNGHAVVVADAAAAANAGAVSSPGFVAAGGAARLGGGALEPYVFPRQVPAAAIGTLASIADRFSGSTDLSATFWKPDESKGEDGLLAALTKRAAQYTGGGAKCDFLPLMMRPNVELANNFSNYRNERVDLSGDRFKLSRATQALAQLNRVGSEGTVNVSAVKEGLRAGIPQMQTDEYFLVKYRDYSDFAVSRWSDEARRDRVFAPKFVERFFAVRVGTSHGVFVALSQAQFAHANELLQTANMAPEAVANGRVVPALGTDQFRSLGVPSAEFDATPPGGAASAAGGADDELDLPPAPHPFDWSAAAVSVRWRRFKRQQLHQFGRVAFKLLLVGGAAVYIRFYWFAAPSAGVAAVADSRAPRRKKANAQLVRDVLSLPINALGWLASSRGSPGYDD